MPVFTARGHKVALVALGPVTLKIQSIAVDTGYWFIDMGILNIF